MSYSIGFGLTPELAAAIDALPDEAWTPAYDCDAVQREGAKVTELTHVVNLSKWPAGMRLIVRAEKPHPGAQLRFTDSNGWRLTAFATNTAGGQLAQLELRHRRRARCEDRIRNAKDTGLANLPLHDFAQNEIWLAIVTLACDLTAWMQMLVLTPHVARRWEPKRLRLRLLSNHRPRRPPHPAATIRTRAPRRRHHRRNRPTENSPTDHLTSPNTIPRPERTPGQWNRRAPASDIAATRPTRHQKGHPQERPSNAQNPDHPPHEISRLGE